MDGFEAARKIRENKFDNAVVECENDMTLDKRIKYIENELQARLHSIVKIINITMIREE